MKLRIFLPCIILLISCEKNEPAPLSQEPNRSPEPLGEVIYKQDTMLFWDALFDTTAGAILLIDDSLNIDNPPADFCINGIIIQRDSLREGSFTMPGFEMALVKDIFCPDTELDGNDEVLRSAQYSITKIDDSPQYRVAGTALDSSGIDLSFQYQGRFQLVDIL